MKIRLRLMRRDGQKRPMAEVRADPGHLVTLTVHRSRDGSEAMAHVSASSQPFRLSRVRLTTLHGADFALLGEEPAGLMYEGRTQPQAWWCQLATAAAGEAGGCSDLAADAAPSATTTPPVVSPPSVPSR